MWCIKIFIFLVIYHISKVYGKGDDDNKIPTDLIGTWTSKSKSVMTGPKFFNPGDELLIEPGMPGLSYSFSKDGYFEEALYRVSSNPKNHSCATAVLIYQHGKFQVNSSGAIHLSPFLKDGRMLLSDPCNDLGISTYSTYEQVETFTHYETYVDDWNNANESTLQLYQADGAPLQKLVLVDRNVIMLPSVEFSKNKENKEKDKRSLLRKRGYEMRFDVVDYDGLHFYIVGTELIIGGYTIIDKKKNLNWFTAVSIVNLFISYLIYCRFN